MEIAVLTMIITSNSSSPICLNGNLADKPCSLAMPPNDYVCTSDPRNSKCERINGTYYCCPTKPAARPPCRDKSTFCSFLTGFCASPEHRSMMEGDCAATCGYCIKEVGLPQNATYAPITMNNATGFQVHQGRNETNFVAANDQPVKANSRVRGRGPERAVEVSTVITNDQLFGKEVFPEVTTADPDELPISLVKTVIKGKCFDEYMYCREFVALCTHPTFSYTMAKRCALSCDRCEDVRMEEELIERQNCTDIFTNCDEHKHLCTAERYRYLLEEKCARTCGYCKPACRDRHPNCRQFKNDGFCVDTMYTVDERQYLCGDSCHLCNDRLLSGLNATSPV